MIIVIPILITIFAYALIYGSTRNKNWELYDKEQSEFIEKWNATH